MDFPLPVASGSFTSSSVGMAVYENGGEAVEILSLSCMAAEIWISNTKVNEPLIHIHQFWS